ncbi:MAG: hypothetical protein IKP81_12930 [Paludibacteraceae bacterium]|nr:hypothetical protein [Paludibacteraceae bacterium]
MKFFFFFLLFIFSCVESSQGGIYEDAMYANYYDDGTSSGDKGFVSGMIILGLIIFLVLYGYVERFLKIKRKTIFFTNKVVVGYPSKECYSGCKYTNQKFYTNVDGHIFIPEGAKCIVLDYYWKDHYSHAWIKVKFEDYQSPVYLDWHSVSLKDTKGKSF